MTPEPEESNIEQIIDAAFDLSTGRYRTDTDEVVSCAMLDQSIIFTIGEDENGL